MRILIIYFSLSGNTKKLSTALSKHLNCDLEEITVKRKLKKCNFFKKLRIVFNKNPELEEIKSNFDDYDMIFLGTPVWGGSAPFAVKKFLSVFKDKINEKKVNVFFVAGADKGNIENIVKSYLPNISYFIDFTHVKTTLESSTKKLIEWTDKCINQAEKS